MTKILRSPQFDDIYFSPENGLAETRYVFLKNSNLPEAWKCRSRFTIAETGFGTGLNFLAAWTLFEETAPVDAILDYISFEKYPLSTDEILGALSHWSGEFGGRLEKLAALYPMRIAGWHRVVLSPRVHLTLIFDDVNDALPRVDVPAGVNAWFLDGFAPKKNPDMWTPLLFGNMARLSNPGATVATFTAAGSVRRSLAAAGFSVEKRMGYGFKLNMVAARLNSSAVRVLPAAPKVIAVAGGGLAGAACAHVFLSYGLTPVIFEAAPSLATGASGNPRGIFNPRFSAQRGAEADFYSAAFALTVRTLANMPGDIGYQPCGSLHLVTDDDKRKRFSSCLETWGWHDDHMRLLSAAEASVTAGVALNHDALYLPDSGQVSPHALVHHWARDADLRLSTALPADHGCDAVVLACAAAARDFVPGLPLHTVRGQIVECAATPSSASLRTNLCFGGYAGPAAGGRHVIGSTFQKWLTTTEILAADTDDILDRFHLAVPSMNVGEVVAARAALRCSSHDRFPLIGGVPGKDGWWISAGHGSHGIVSALAGAHFLASALTGRACPLPRDSANLLHPGRFAERAQRKTGNHRTVS